jgi:hypothetical protein
MRKITTLATVYAVVFTLAMVFSASGVAAAGSTHSSKPKLLVGTYSGMVGVASAAGFSHDTATFTIAEQGVDNYLFIGRFVATGIDEPIYGFVDGYTFYGWGENLELMGTVIPHGKKPRAMQIMIGNTSATPSSMASGDFKEVKE